MRERNPAVYIMASRRNGTLYVGVTSNLPRRVAQHREADGHGFAARYGCKNLVYFEQYADMPGAIARERQLKDKSRAAKMALIESGNPAWRDLWSDIA